MLKCSVKTSPSSFLSNRHRLLHLQTTTGMKFDLLSFHLVITFRGRINSKKKKKKERKKERKKKVAGDRLRPRKYD